MVSQKSARDQFKDHVEKIRAYHKIKGTCIRCDKLVGPRISNRAQKRRWQKTAMCGECQQKSTEISTN